MALTMPTSLRYGSPGTMPPAAQPVIDAKHEEKYPERSVAAYDTKGGKQSDGTAAWRLRQNGQNSRSCEMQRAGR